MWRVVRNAGSLAFSATTANIRLDITHDNARTDLNAGDLFGLRRTTDVHALYNKKTCTIRRKKRYPRGRFKTRGTVDTIYFENAVPPEHDSKFYSSLAGVGAKKHHCRGGELGEDNVTWCTVSCTDLALELLYAQSSCCPLCSLRRYQSRLSRYATAPLPLELLPLPFLLV